MKKLSPEVLVLGAGSMVEAILLGLKSSLDLKNFSIYSPSGVSAQKLASKVGAQATQLSEVLTPEWILVGCKPQQLPELKLLLGDNYGDSLFVSMLAALPEKNQCQILSAKRLIRIMPNLPVKYGCGVTLLSSNSAAGELPLLQNIFSKLGEALVVSEQELAELTLLTGSGPALYYEFAHNLSAGFTSLDSHSREKLARAVLIGAAVTLKEEERSLQELIGAVTSKGGVTIAVLEGWRHSRLIDVIHAGLSVGKERALSLLKATLQN